MTSTHARRQALRALLERGVRGTQAQLCEELARLGHETTQSTISRDLRVLGATRIVDAEGVWVHQLPQLPQPLHRATPTGDRPSAPFDGMVEAIERNEVLLVVRTLAGRAPAVGLELDALDDPDILGTIAGDDTVLVIPRSITRLDALVARLRALTALPVSENISP
jgi:transcriptional regulator of arginine metabolism